jgi:hypothetical protein
MPLKIKPAPVGYTGLWPQTHADRKVLWMAVATGLLAVIAVVAIFYLSQSEGQRRREANWSRASSVVEQVRPVLAGEHQGKYGGWMLYNAQVLVTFNDGQGTQKRWVTLRQAPQSLSQVNFDASRWIGRSCIVRWNPANSNEIDVEIS